MTSADLAPSRAAVVVTALWSRSAWRATMNGLAALLVSAISITLLGLIVIVWGAAIQSLVTGPGNAGHYALYIATVIVGPVAELLTVQGVTALQLSRLRAVAGVDIPASARAAERKPWPIGPWLSAGTWRQIAFHLLSAGTGLAGGLVVGCWLGPAIAIGYLIVGRPSPAAGAVACVAAVMVMFAAPWLAQLVARADAGLARSLLGPSRSEELALRLESLARSRAEIVAATDAERRRIERDLHDGTQQRLVSLALNLGMARERVSDGPDDVPAPMKRVIAEAHEEALLALSEVREFIRGLHPAVLNDRGLDAALSGLAARAPLPVKLTVDLPARRASPSVEAVAYFIVSEALTNVVKHSQATQAEVAVSRDGDTLRIVVTDNGTGGAALEGTGGTGLRGLMQRAASVDGTLAIDSPPGGPTVITAELPCAS
ncbi:MAG TPA: histidine kinase [Streptosporangiaceae bacterium]|nr:histidine kinase [Streptosporangiaceae bacterium]